MLRYRWLMSASLVIASSNGAFAQTAATATGPTPAESTGVLSSLTSLFKTRSVSNPSANASSFSNASSNVSSVSTGPGPLTRLYRAVWSPDSASSPKRATSFSYPAGLGQSNSLPMLGPSVPLQGTTTFFPIPVTPGTLQPVLPRSGGN